MTKITDNDLILLYYGEHEDAELPRRVAEDPALRARLDELSRELEPLDRFPVPEPDPELGVRTWQRISSRIAEGSVPQRSGWLASLLAPRFSFAGLFAIVAVAGLAFLLGRESAPEMTEGVAGTTPAFAIDSRRLLNTRVGEHLTEADVLLTGLANADADPRNADWAAAMVLSNRIYAQAAESAGHDQLARLLREMEPILIEIANRPDSSVPVDDSLLFRIRTQAEQLDPNEPI
ncbi:MAG: hypothetical protein R3200_12615 [Xanthomonadales bacterium]|nr:hypothetical protein [Xanthomonadales bacterium]